MRVGKVEMALMRKQADIYHSSGQFKKERDLYIEVLSCFKNLPQALKADIENRINRIEYEIASETPDQCTTNSGDQGAVVRQQSGQPSLQDILFTAMRFYQKGLFRDALAELRNLKRKRGAPERAKGLITACLAQLYGYERLPAAADRLAREFYSKPEKILWFQLGLAEKLLNWRCREQACAIIGHVRRQNELSPEIQQRIIVLIRTLSGKGPEHTIQRAQQTPLVNGLETESFPASRGTFN
jgi:hypothetical protein